VNRKQTEKSTFAAENAFIASPSSATKSAGVWFSDSVANADK